MERFNPNNINKNSFDNASRNNTNTNTNTTSANDDSKNKSSLFAAGNMSADNAINSLPDSQSSTYFSNPRIDNGSNITTQNVAEQNNNDNNNSWFDYKFDDIESNNNNNNSTLLDPEFNFKELESNNMVDDIDESNNNNINSWFDYKFDNLNKVNMFDDLGYNNNNNSWFDDIDESNNNNNNQMLTSNNSNAANNNVSIDNLSKKNNDDNTSTFFLNLPSLDYKIPNNTIPNNTNSENESKNDPTPVPAPTLRNMDSEVHQHNSEKYNVTTSDNNTNANTVPHKVQGAKKRNFTKHNSDNISCNTKSSDTTTNENLEKFLKEKLAQQQMEEKSVDKKTPSIIDRKYREEIVQKYHEETGENSSKPVKRFADKYYIDSDKLHHWIRKAKNKNHNDEKPVVRNKQSYLYAFKLQLIEMFYQYNDDNPQHTANPRQFINMFSKVFKLTNPIPSINFYNWLKGHKRADGNNENTLTYGSKYTRKFKATMVAEYYQQKRKNPLITQKDFIEKNKLDIKLGCFRSWCSLYKDKAE